MSIGYITNHEMIPNKRDKEFVKMCNKTFEFYPRFTFSLER
jgi:hypothetical protein